MSPTFCALRRAALLTLGALALPAASASAQVVWSEGWESGLGGWTTSGFSGRPISIGTSALISSQGANSLFITQDGEGFSWNSKLEVGMDPGNPLYQAWQAMSTVPENLVQVSFDVIYRGADIPNEEAPGDPNDFMNLAMWMNNDNGFRQFDGPPGLGLALLGGGEIASDGDFIIPVSVTISQFTGFGDKIPTGANFYQIGWSINGDFGAGNGTVDGGPGNLQPGEATVYYDNFRMEIIPEPAGLAVLSLGALGLLRRRRN